MPCDTRTFLLIVFALGLVVPLTLDLDSGALADAVVAAEVSQGSLLDGEAPRRFEEHLRRHGAFMRRTRPYWNEFMIEAFDEAPTRVVVGRHGWLFYAPSVTPADAQAANHHLVQNVDELVAMAAPWRGRPVRFVVVVMPSKFRLYEDQLGRPIRDVALRDNYAVVLRAIAERGLEAPDVLAVLAARRDERSNLLAAPNDSHLTQEAFAIVVTEIIAPAAGVAAATAEARLRERPMDGAMLHRGDLLDLLGIRPGSRAEKKRLFHEAAFLLPPTHDAAGSDIILAGDSNTIHRDRLLGRLIEAATGQSVDGRLVDGGHRRDPGLMPRDYAVTPPHCVFVVVSERIFMGV